MSNKNRTNLNRRRFVLQSVAGSLALPGLPSLMADSVGPRAAIQTAKGAGTSAHRFVAVGNLLGFQQNQFFPETTGTDYQETTLLKPLSGNRDHYTLYRGLDHGIRGGHFAVQHVPVRRVAPRIQKPS